MSRSACGVASTLRVTGDKMMEALVRSREPIAVADARLDARTDKAMVDRLGSRTIVKVPLDVLHKPFASIGTGTFGEDG